MPNHLGTFPIGEEVQFTFKARERETNNAQDGELISVRGLTADIIDPDGNTDTTGATFTFEQDGKYRYYFDTSGKVPGAWKINVTVGTNNAGNTTQKSATFTLEA